ncbi:glycine betaine ABC transporter substrate-binding protein [uncultured Aquimarina sp.]|uniref:glycine betaine ABC transporter substrate-binding protein n=1 Tax=uncultured Aquimarina sp. TaxID=575652 RepID=UPI00262699C7|nr:glycine betaine ABC transporter substrate-binding protein [uncultured Aquimarina sp.]
MSNNKITIGVTNLSFHRIAASLVTNVLMDMGFEVNRIYAHHEKNFQNLQEGKTDILTSAWLPSSHGEYRAEVQKIVPLTDFGLHYEPYALWGVPDYVPGNLVSEVSDLLKPVVLEKMTKRIQGINPGAGISRFSAKMIDEYQLGTKGYSFHTGTEEDCFRTFEKAVLNKEWLVVPLWKPQFLHHKYTIRELKDPIGLLGSVDKAVLVVRDDREHLFSPEQLVVLDNLRFGNEVIASLDYKVSREGENIDEVTKEWLTNNKLQ